jgi:hypothetical protein
MLHRNKVDISVILNLILYSFRWGRTARRKHLLLTKCFLCCCQRCLDPTECGTYISALKCAECGGNMVQEMGVNSSDLDNDWWCNSCSQKMSNKKATKLICFCLKLTSFQVLATEGTIGKMLKIINKKSTQHLEGVSRKLSKCLSAAHYILLEIYISLISEYEKKNEKQGNWEEGGFSV